MMQDMQSLSDKRYPPNMNPDAGSKPVAGTSGKTVLRASSGGHVSRLGVPEFIPEGGSVNVNVNSRSLPTFDRAQSHPYSVLPNAQTNIPLSPMRVGHYGATPPRTFSKNSYTSPFHTYSPMLTPKSVSIPAYVTADSDLTSEKSQLLQKFEGAEVQPRGVLSVWNAGISILNLFLGLALLSYPYAIRMGGLIGILPLAFIAYAANYTAKILVRCFNRLAEANQRTYPNVGFAACGGFGSSLIIFGVVFEIFGAACVSLIFIWKNVSYLCGDTLTMFQVAIISTICILPSMWMLNFAQLSFNSLLGFICKLLVVLVIIYNFIVDFPVEGVVYEVFPESAMNMSVCIGIFILSLAGHPVLPAIYSQMAEPEKFETVLNWCFFIMFLVYALMSVFGYMLYGKETSIVITENIIAAEYGANGSAANFTRILIAQILIGFVVAGCYCSVSPIVAILAEIPEAYANITNPWAMRVFRTVLFGVVSLCSYLIIANLAILESITGSVCTMVTSVICPALFYYALYRTELHIATKATLISIIVFGVVFGVFLLSNDILSAIANPAGNS